ncbi:MAG TPA: peroxiredoxin [Acidimicrobiia bacterium]|nr:peroxiredoxin [Acidimicrobiia bacterium]
MDIGETAPDFELAADDGRKVKLSDELAKGPVVLFFYPKALTSGCTRESCHFRDLASEFAAAGAQRIGISADSVDRQRKFSEKHSFDFTLLSDPDRTVARQFGVKRPGPLFNKRVTFVIDTDRRVLDVIRSETNMETHADQALATLAKR